MLPEAVAVELLFARTCSLRSYLSRALSEDERIHSRQGRTSEDAPEQLPSAYLPIYAEFNDTFEKLGK
jgi:hypothetical protein